MATGVGIYASGLMTSKLIELLSIAFDASHTHMYAPGTQRHIKAALKLGATPKEIMEVLKPCVVQGIQACNLGVKPVQSIRTALTGARVLWEREMRFVAACSRVNHWTANPHFCRTAR
jgi:hypothetical protein